jgi:hypothetical protein
MKLPRWCFPWQCLNLPVGIEFWLPLPLVGLMFWFGGGITISKILSRSYLTTTKLPANTELAVKLETNDVVIQAEIDRQQQVTRVEVRSLSPERKDLNFELSTTEFDQVEAGIAEKLGVIPETVKDQVRYQLRP